MPRWLLAVFVLQLLWNMAGFPAVGQPYERAQASGHSVLAAHEPHTGMTGLAEMGETQVLPDDLPPAPRGPGTAANGLLDDLPDLPDTLLRRASAKSLAAPTPHHAGWVQKGSPDALVAALFRPPPHA